MPPVLTKVKNRKLKSLTSVKICEDLRVHTYMTPQGFYEGFVDYLGSPENIGMVQKWSENGTKMVPFLKKGLKRGTILDFIWVPF